MADLETEERIAVVDPNGIAGTVLQSQLQQAMAMGYTLESGEAFTERRQQAEFGHAPITAGLEGAARGLTFGGSDILLDQFGEGTAQRKQRNPLAALLGEGASLVAPLGAPGLISKAGRAVEGALAGTEAIRALDAGGTAARLLGGAAKMGAQAGTEGALFGVGQTVSKAALSDDPMNAEALAAELGGNMLYGGLIGAGAGAGLSSLGSAARAAAVRVRNAAGRWAESTADEVAAAAPASPRMAGALGEELGGAPVSQPAMGSPDVWSDLASKHTAGEHAAVRDGIASAMDETYGIRPAPGDVRFEKIGKKVNGIANWDGSIVLQPELQGGVGDMLQDLAAGKVAQAPAKKQGALRTLVHEMLHQTGITPAAYQGGGAVVEEVVTEIAARRMMRDLGARVVAQSSEEYDDAISAVVNAVKARTRSSFDDAAKMVEDAALSMKGAGAQSGARTTAARPIDHIEDFVSNIPGLNLKSRQKLIDDIFVMDVEHVPAATRKVPLSPSLEGEAAEHAEAVRGLDLAGAKEALAHETESLRQAQLAARQALGTDAVKVSRQITDAVKDLPALSERVGVGEPELGTRLLGAARSLDTAIDGLAKNPDRFLEVLSRVERHLTEAGSVLPSAPAPTTVLWQQFVKDKITPYVKKYGGRDAAMGQLSKEYRELKQGLAAKLPEKGTQIQDALGEIETMRNRVQATMADPASARLRALEEHLEELRRPKPIEDVISEQDRAVLVGPQSMGAPAKATVPSEVQDFREAARIMGGYLPGIAARAGETGKGFIREINQAERALSGVAKLPNAILRHPARALDALEGYEQTLRQFAAAIPEKDATIIKTLADRSAKLQARLDAALAPPSVGHQVAQAIREKALDAVGPIAGGIVGSAIGGPVGLLTGAVVGAGLGALRKRLGSSASEFATAITAKLDAAIGTVGRTTARLADDAAALASRRRDSDSAPKLADKVALGISFGASKAAAGRDARHDQALDIIAAAADLGTARQKIHDGLTAVRVIDPALADQLEQQAVRRLEYLASVAPKDPGLGTPGKDRWTPTDVALAKFARIVAVTEQPLRLLDHLSSDTLTPPLVDAVKNVYPAIWQRIQSMVLERLASAPALSASRALGLAMLTGSPIDSRMRPEYLAAQQQRFAAMRAEAAAAKQQGPKPPPRHGVASDAELTASQSAFAH